MGVKPRAVAAGNSSLTKKNYKNKTIPTSAFSGKKRLLNKALVFPERALLA